MRSVETLRTMLSRLRMAMLGYRYDYDRPTNERIIASIFENLKDALNDPDDERRRLVRTLAQYRAQLATRPLLSKWIFELASIAALPFFLLTCWLAWQLQGRTKNAETIDGLQLVFAGRWRRNPEIFVVPEELREKVIVTQSLVRHRLSSTDARLISRLLVLSFGRSTPFPFQLALKCAVDIAAVRAAISCYSLSFILVYWEFSCSLSAITQAMAASGIETHNVMHGDKHFYAKHAFFEVHRCYCWNSFYADLFREEYASADFRLFTNPGFILSEEEKSYQALHPATGIGVAAPHLATLAKGDHETEEAARLFANTLNALTSEHPVTIRPHPFYQSKFKSLSTHLSDKVKIEHPSEKSARMFLLDHFVIVGTASTLLLEAAHLGRNVVIVNTPVMRDVESYHFLYGMKNVSLCTLDTLKDVIKTIDDGAPVGQTGPSPEQTIETA